MQIIIRTSKLGSNEPVEETSGISAHDLIAVASFGKTGAIAQTAADLLIESIKQTRPSALPAHELRNAAGALTNSICSNWIKIRKEPSHDELCESRS